MNKDNLYSNPQSVEDFVFDSKVVNVFDDMIKRSVPGYGAIITMIGCLAEKYVLPNTHVYDLGCSLGSATISIAQKMDSSASIIAIDNSQDMINQAQVNLDQANVTAKLICDDVHNINMTNASMTVMNFVLQFINLDSREEIIKNIYDGLNDGGIFVLSEKIKFEDDQEDCFQREMHHTFKKLNGYSDLEIAQKRTSLENVLIPDTLQTHIDRLKQVGFYDVRVWFQCFNFVSIVAMKDTGAH